MWIRSVNFSISFNCCYAGNFMLAKRAIYENVRILERFIKRPTEELGAWADRVSRDMAEDAAGLACEELSANFYACDIGVYNIRYSEVLVVEKKIEEEIEERKIPRYILGEIEYLENLYKEAETVDEKIAIREEIEKLKRRYGL